MSLVMAALASSLLLAVLACGSVGEDVANGNGQDLSDIKERGEALQESNVERHRALLAKKVQYPDNQLCLSRIEAYQLEYDAVIDRPVDLSGEGEEAVLRFWLNTYYEASKVVDAHEPDINHYCN